MIENGPTLWAFSTFTESDKRFLGESGISALPYPETPSHPPVETADSLGGMSLQDEAAFSPGSVSDPTMAYTNTRTSTNNGSDSYMDDADID